MTSKRALWIGFVALLGALAAAAGLAALIADSTATTAAASRPDARGRLVDIPALATNRTKPPAIPEAVTAAYQRLGAAAAHAAPGLRPGNFLFDEMRLLLSGLGPRNDALYIVPTSTGNLCIYFTALSPGCQDRFTDDAPVSLSVSDPDRLGSGEPFTIYGIYPVDVVNISVVVDGEPQAALMANNGFYYRLADPALIPDSILVAFDDGHVEPIDLPDYEKF
jgi:hypothetical protein